MILDHIDIKWIFISLGKKIAHPLLLLNIRIAKIFHLLTYFIDKMIIHVGGKISIQDPKAIVYSYGEQSKKAWTLISPTNEGKL